MYGEEETYVLKLVKCQRIACHAGSPNRLNHVKPISQSDHVLRCNSKVPTEAENLERVRQQHPGIGPGLDAQCNVWKVDARPVPGADQTIAFPVKLCGLSPERKSCAVKISALDWIGLGQTWRFT